VLTWARYLFLLPVLNCSFLFLYVIPPPLSLERQAPLQPPLRRPVALVRNESSLQCLNREEAKLGLERLKWVETAQRGVGWWHCTDFGNDPNL
jgi:hypothetical protein